MAAMVAPAASRKRSFSAMNGKENGSSPASLQSERADAASSLSSLPSLFSKSFDREASIVLIGPRGSGKSTLGLIGSICLQRRLVDTEDFFRAEMKTSSQDYRRINGPKQFHEKFAVVLSKVLTEHRRNSIIVCSVGNLEGCQDILRDFAGSNPVILIAREARSILEYLKVPEPQKFRASLEASASFFRACSNLEFFNVSEAVPTESQNEDAKKDTIYPFLTLKSTERNFLKFLGSALELHNIPSVDEAFPLSRVPVQQRLFTYSVTVPFSSFLSASLDIGSLEVGADAFELVIDSDASRPGNRNQATNGRASSMLSHSIQINKISEVFGLVRNSTIVPIIYHVPPRTEEEKKNGSNNSSAISHDRYLELLGHGLRLAPEFVTVDLNLDDEVIKDILRRKGSTKMIAHCYSSKKAYHNWNDPFWISAYERALGLGFDLVRLCWPASRVEDNLETERLRGKVSELKDASLIPIIAYNTGHLGRTSACFNKILTPVTHNDLALARLPETPCITAAEATRALNTSFVFEPMRFYVFGGATSYSLSPLMHSSGYQALGMPHVYTYRQSNSINDLLALAEDPHFGGASIALPFKVEVITVIDSLSHHAAAIGAVNTLIPIRSHEPVKRASDNPVLFNGRNRSGRLTALYGENTDWIGIRACILRGLSPVNAIRPNTTGLVIGAGGMARSTIYSMLQLGVQNIVIWNRTFARAESVISHFQSLLQKDGETLLKLGKSAPFLGAPVRWKALPSDDEPWPTEFTQPTIIVSCIPTHAVGDDPSPEFSLPLEWLKASNGGVVVELAYKTLDSPLLKQIRAKANEGWVAMDGLDLLPEQGFAQFELFTGRRAPRKVMTVGVLKKFNDNQSPEVQEIIRRKMARTQH